MGVVNGCGRMEVFMNDGDGILECHEIMFFCSRKVVSVYLVTDRTYVFNS